MAIIEGLVLLERSEEARAMDSTEKIKMPTHNRFHRKVWASNDDFAGYLAKWLVIQSPYAVPDRLSICIEKFHALIGLKYNFDNLDLCEFDLLILTEEVEKILWDIPEIAALNERKNGRQGNGFEDRHHDRNSPDDSFIDIGAVASNITCEFADRADAEAYLDLNEEKKNG